LSCRCFKKVGNYLENVDLSIPSIPNENDIGVLSGETQSNTFTRYLYSSLYSTLNETVKQLINKPLNEIIISCFYNFEICDKRDFTYFASVNYGPCLKYTPAKPLTKPGFLNGLQLDILLDPLLVTEVLWAERGLNIVLKKRGEHIGYFEGFTIKSGQRTSIGVSETSFENLPKPYSKCVPDKAEFPSELYKYITESTTSKYNQG